MAIVIEEAPDGLLDLLASGLANLPPVTDGAAGAEGAQLYRPLPLYSAGTGALVGAPDDRPQPLERVGWRVLVDEGPALAIAEVRWSDEGPALTALWRGAVADLLAEATVLAEEAIAGEQVYRARVISLPEIGIEALWLHADNETDVVVPLLEEGARPVPLREFAADARRRAMSLAPHRDGAEEP